MLSILTLKQPLSSSFGRAFVICLVKTTLATKQLFFWGSPFFRDRQDGLGKLVKNLMKFCLIFPTRAHSPILRILCFLCTVCVDCCAEQGLTGKVVKWQKGKSPYRLGVIELMDGTKVLTIGSTYRPLLRAAYACLVFLPEYQKHMYAQYLPDFKAIIEIG